MTRTRSLIFIALIALLLGAAVSAQEATPEVTPELTAEATMEITPDVAPVEPLPPGTIREFPGFGSYSIEATQRGMDRAYNVYIPESYLSTTAPTALVIVLHGANGTGVLAEQQTGFSALADEFGFIAAYPDGINGYWNDGRPAAIDSRIDPAVSDSAYLLGVITFLQSTLSIDPARVYVTGYSMGGMMALRAGCELGERVAAVASVASTMPEYVTPYCDVAAPLPVLFMVGTDDRIVPWTGSPRSGIGYMSAFNSLDYWARHNGCTDDADVLALPDSDPDDRIIGIVSRHNACAGGASATLFGFVFGGHTWPGHRNPMGVDPGLVAYDVDGTQVIWDFFAAHPRGE